MNEQTEDFLSIDTWIKKGYSFAIYRAPRENNLHIIIQYGGDVYVATDIKELNGKKGFVIAPFNSSVQTPICLIHPDDSYTIDINTFVNKSSEKKQSISYSSCENDYIDKFNLFIAALQNGQFEKLVLSRHCIATGEMDVKASFKAACGRYKYSYVYYLYTPITGAWMGSTPEVLLSNVTGKWMTVALAGTQSLLQGELPQSWDAKNVIEQDVVCSYIRQLLQENGIVPEETKPYSVKAGALSHLRTDFCFSKTNTEELGTLLKQLHPTPAVCGMPKVNAYQFIIDNEGYERSYYSGFVGVIDPSGITDLYVNLRCIHFVDADKAILYAGGGLLVSSTLQDEWLETEKKMRTMKDILITK